MDRNEKNKNVAILRPLGKDRVEDIMDCCVHFNGMFHNEKCKTGVVYNQVTTKGSFQYRSGERSPVYTLHQIGPCHRQKADAFKAGCCSEAKWPTREQAELKVQEEERHFRQITKARALIAKQNHKSGTVKCPECKKELHYRVASNGHIHAKCETPLCLNWME